MDKRIIKTKKHLYNTLLELLEEKPFDKITVTELCDRADTSRITFYTHYKDKKDLFREFFDLRAQDVVARYEELQSKNNPNHDPLQGYHNRLDAIFEIYFAHERFFDSAFPDKSLDFTSPFYWHVVGHFNELEKEYSAWFESEGSNKHMSVVITAGLLGFISACTEEKMSKTAIKKEGHAILERLLVGNAFESKSEKQD